MRRYYESIFGANQLMMLKIHVTGKGVAGKICRALFAGGEWHGNPPHMFVAHGPGGHHGNRSYERNCDDKSGDPTG